MCKRCELCHSTDAYETRFGIQLCMDCMDGFWKIMKNDTIAIQKYAKEEMFPNATMNAKQQIVGLAKRKLDEGLEKLEPRHVEKIEPLHMEKVETRNKMTTEDTKENTKENIKPQQGITLTSPEGLDDLSAKCNIIYVIGIIVMALFFGNIILGIIFGLVAGWIIKGPMILKSATYKFRTMEFSMPANITLEEIYREISPKLNSQELDVTLQENNLEFHHGSIHYQFLADGTEGTFRLRWYYSVAKAMLGSRDIHDYKVVRQDTGLIAYAIQNVSVENGDTAK